MGKIVLGKPLTVEEFVEVARFHAEVEFSEEYCERVKKSREIVEKCVEEDRVVYGTTTGFGALVTKVISKDEAARLQRNIIITHSTSVGAGESRIKKINELGIGHLHIGGSVASESY